MLMSLFMSADITINYSFIASEGIFALAHLIILVYFLRHEKLNRYSFIAAGFPLSSFFVSSSSLIEATTL